ncbi:hypothetical protein ACFW04_012009 [Cataglyphis niger]
MQGISIEPHLSLHFGLTIQNEPHNHIWSLRDPLQKINQTEDNKRYHREYAAGSLDYQSISDRLDDIFQKKHWIKPLSIAGSNIKDSDHLPLTDNNDENEPLKRLKREETVNYRAIKLQILREIKEAFEKQKQ